MQTATATATDMPIEMANKEVAETTVKLPISGTIISTNGLKITSKLNPDAKEFYPAYLLRQKIMREIGDVGGGGGGGGGVGQTLTPPLHFAHNNNPNVLKAIKLDGLTVNQMETDVDTLKEGMGVLKPLKEASKIEILAEHKSVNVQEKENEKEKENKYTREMNYGIEKGEVEGEEEIEMVDAKDIEEEDLQTSEGDGTDLENFEDAEGEPMTQLLMDKAELGKLKSTEIECAGDYNTAPKEDLSDCENHEQYSDQGSTETLNEYGKCKDDTESVEVSELSEENDLAEEEALHDLPQILEEIKETNSLCGDGETECEAEAEAEAECCDYKGAGGEAGVCKCVGVGDGYSTGNQIINEYQSKLTMAEVVDNGTSERTSSECDAPPNTPTEMSGGKSLKTAAAATMTTKSSRLSKGKTQKDKDDKKKSEKRTTLRKLASISLSLRGKSSSSHHGEKTTTTRTSSSGGMTRTKRLSESLHNLTSGLKSKVDGGGKKSDGSGRFLPRSATNIPRPPTSRARSNTLSRSTEANGMNYKAPKVRATSVASNATTTTTNCNASAKHDSTSLKSASSSEQGFTMKSAAQLLKKPLFSKTTNSSAAAAVSEKSGIPTVSVTKSKDSVGSVKTRPPRGTLASTLRQSEAQKRRNLFPNDDDGESNIELSQFLFK